VGRDFPRLSRPALGPTKPPVQWVPGLNPDVKCGRGVLLTTHSFWCRGHGRVEIYLYPTSGPHRAFNGVTLLIGFHIKYPIFVSDFNEIWKFLGIFSVNHTYQISFKNPSFSSRNVPCRQTDKHDAIRNFANAPGYHSFPQTCLLKCFNAFVINVLAAGPTKGFNLYWTTHVIFDVMQITKKKYVNSHIVVLCLRLK
jgi:hypothetical protein